MSDLALYEPDELVGYEMRYNTGGNPRNTGGFKTTGYCPNLPGHLRKTGVHVLDYTKATERIASRSEDSRAIVLYRIMRPTGLTRDLYPDDDHVGVLAEVVDHEKRTINYVEYQIDRDEYDMRMRALLQGGAP